MKVWKRAEIWAIFILLYTIFIFAPNCSASDTFYGIGMYSGEQWKSATFIHVSPTYDWREFQLHPIYGQHLSDKWDIWFEGELGYIKWNSNNSVMVGIMLMTSYDIVQYKNYNLFGELGVGVGWISYSPSINTLGHNPAGLIDLGAGVEYKNFRIGPRFHHTSSMFGKDAGINTFGCMLTIRR